MSDSTDTDILLLIPPNYFLTKAFENTQQEIQSNKNTQTNPQLYCLCQTLDSSSNNMNVDEHELMPPPPAAPMSAPIKKTTTTTTTTTTPTAAYKFLKSNEKAELNHINSRLNALEREEPQLFTTTQQFATASGVNCEASTAVTAAGIVRHFTGAGVSDVSTISNCTARTPYDTNQKARSSMGQVVHSTPKYKTTKEQQQQQQQQQVQEQQEQLVQQNNERVRNYLDNNVLLEIDNFLEDRRFSCDNNWQQQQQAQQQQQQQQKQTQYIVDDVDFAIHPVTSVPLGLNNVGVEPLSNSSTAKVAAAVNLPDVGGNNLISLSEIWGKSGHSNTIINVTQSALKEEQLRRQHLEKTITALQTRLLEFQQRISVAIEVDRTKDAALNNAQLEIKSLNVELQQLRDLADKLELEKTEYNNKMTQMQQELTQAISLAAKFQEKNEKIETELMTQTKQTNNNINTYKQQIEEFEIKLHGCKKAEEYANNELNKLKDKLAKIDYQNEKLRTRTEEYEKDITTLRTQKETLQELYQKQKTRADNLETQRKTLQEAISSLTDTETALKRKFEIQQKSLKTHYQQQLEKVVAQKLHEFQEQLDKTEETLKIEARERERLIAERAVKQFELINEKMELELNLLQEKHNEEVDLYRFQLANATKKIEDLELKLYNYKSKRADIAEKLHDVMEVQWRKALEILTSPNQTRQTQRNNNSDNESPVGNTQLHTPKISNKNRHTQNNENNLNIIKVQPMDRLQAYIELLLSKSPSDFDKLDQILALTAKKCSKSQKTSAAKRCLSNKPPWKA